MEKIFSSLNYLCIVFNRQKTNKLLLVCLLIVATILTAQNTNKYLQIVADPVGTLPTTDVYVFEYKNMTAIIAQYYDKIRIAHFDTMGRILNVFSVRGVELFDVDQTSGGVVVAFVSSDSFTVLFRIDTIGNIQWSKKFLYSGSTGFSPLIRDMYVIEDTTYIAGTKSFPLGLDTSFVAKVDPNGNIIWQQLIPPPLLGTYASTSKIIYNPVNNKLFVLLDDPFYASNSYLMELNPQSGNLVNIYQFASSIYFIDISIDPYGNLYVLYFDIYNGTYNILKLSPSLAIKQVVEPNIGTFNQSYHTIDIGSDGTILIGGAAERTFADDGIMLITDTGFTNISGYFIGEPGGEERIISIKVDAKDSQIISLAIHQAIFSAGILLGKFPYNDISYRCNVTPISPYLTSRNVTFSSITPVSPYPASFSYIDTPVNLQFDSLVLKCFCTINANYLTTANPYVCTNDSADFYYIGDTADVLWYEWYFAPGTNPPVDSSKNPSGINFSSSGFAINYLRVSDVACQTEITIPITVHQSPTVSFASSLDTVCEHAYVDFFNTGSTGNWNYIWDFGQDAVPRTSLDENPTSISWNSPGTKKIVFSISNQFCSETAIDSIYVLDRPSVDFLYPVQACQWDTVEGIFIGDTLPGASIIWFYTNAITDSGYGSVDSSIYITSGWQSVTVTAINPNGCIDSLTKIIKIDSTPEVAILSADSVCAGIPISFQNGGTTGLFWNFLWDFGQTANPNLSTLENPSGVIFSQGGLFPVSLTIRNVITGCSNTAVDTIWVWNLPIAEAGPPDTTICFADTIRIGTTPLPRYSYNWIPNAQLSSDTISNPLVFPVSYFSTYTVTVTDSNGCSSKDSIKIYMLDAISVDIGRDLDICRGDTVVLQATYSLNYAYSWMPLFNISDSVGNMVYVWPDTTTVYVVMAQDTSIYRCGYSLDSVVVRVHSAPALTVEPRGDTIAKGESIRLIASGAAEFQWFPDYALDNSGIADPVASPDTTTVYVVRGTDVYGCYGYDTVVVYVRQPHVWVPDVFSPNGDGINDGVKVLGYGFVDYEFVIYDRFGNLVFYSQDPDQRWYGDGLNGEPCPEGAYSYYFVVTLSDGETIEGSGLINLVR